MKKLLPIILGIISIAVAVYAIFRISHTTEFAINFLVISFGLLALIWSYKAYQSLAPNSSLRSYSLLFAAALTLIVLNRILAVMSTFIIIKTWYNYLEYLTVISAYLLFVAASYKILAIGKEFGFADSTLLIKEALKEKKKKK